MVLNTAVALKLAGNTQELSEFKSAYDPLMAGTALANSFAIVTRPAGRTTLSDRDTMLNIAGEVDLFRGFLDSYRGTEPAVDAQESENPPTPAE